ncbi:hypothetical protein PG985_003406 [Apiospora marii]|uniref:uncharacterized protein n=1 Tax=Apiospora marii TaxID=335849 RepID=UPI00312E2801
MATYTTTAAAGGSSTAVLEMHDIPAPHSKLEEAQQPLPDSAESSSRRMRTRSRARRRRRRLRWSSAGTTPRPTCPRSGHASGRSS